MGNRVTQALDKWGLNPKKSVWKRSKRETPPTVPQHKTHNVHIYDPVTAEPEYAKVNKRKKTEDHNELHYAEIQVLQSGSTSKPKAATHNNATTEYATIDFLLKGVKANATHEPADILIPPGELQRPMIKSKRVKSAPPQQTIGLLS